MESHSSSLRGGEHPRNEDFLVRCNHSSGHGRKVCFLADGQGGRPDGDVASQSACKRAVELVQETSWDDLFHAATWDGVFHEADLRVREVCEGFASMVGLVCDSHSVFGASVGDCKVYAQTGQDEAVLELTERQDKNPPMGGGVQYVASFALSGYHQSTILMLSDGVWKFTGFNSITDSLALPDILDIPDYLKTEVLNRQASDQLPDDFSVLVIRS